MRKGYLVAAIVIMVLCLASVTAWGAAKIKIQDYSPRDVEADATKTVSPGIPNVGVHTKVWLSADGAGATSTLAWAVLSKPTASAITAVDNATSVLASFTPDAVGGYQIELSENAAAVDTVWVNAGTWVGVGTIGGTSASPPQCAICHTSQAADWEMTGHADFFELNITGQGSSYYAASCIGCHTVGADGDTTLANWNGGWDDWADSLNWTFPDTLIASNWTDLTSNYPELAKLANIQCENCHGPGSEHKGATNKNQIAATYSSGVCAACHDEGEHYIIPNQLDYAAHSGSMHSATYAGDHCSYCHTANGFVHETVNSQAHPADNYGDEATSISCQTCHDPHDASNTHQLRVEGEVYETCYSCHKVWDRYEGASLHYSVQGFMLDGDGGHRYAGEEYSNGHHREVPEKCVTCHMAEVTDEIAAMADSVQFSVGGHSFAVSTELGDGTVLLNDSGCRECHGATPEFLEMSQGTVQALLDTLEAYLPKGESHGRISVLPETDTTLTAVQRAAVTNWQFVDRDHSLGVHNHVYAVKLLTDAIADVKAVGDMPIIAISDMPSDQGRQVRVTWRAHPREGTVTDPVIAYHVWRRDTDAGLVRPSADGGAELPRVNSLADLATAVDGLTPGGRVMVDSDQEVWVYLESVPAAGLERYGAVVPTIADSTIAGGQHYSVFMISASTAVPGLVYQSDPDSGYSVDNLAPTAPASAIGSRATTGQNHLEWSEPIEADFNYFAIFRGDNSGFDPAGLTAIATTTANAYDDTPPQAASFYYYRIAAVDFAGNMSEYSDEIAVSPTAIGGEEASLPKTFSLSQNFPNPFNPETAIQVGLPRDSMVRLQVYNLTGQMVRSLLDQRMPAGFHKVKWDGRDNNGRQVNSGVYFYRIVTDEFSQTRKMVLLK